MKTTPVKSKKSPKTKPPKRAKVAGKAIRPTAPAKKSAPTKKKRSSVKNLALKKFGAPEAKPLYSPPVHKKDLEGFSAPPFISDKNKKEAERLNRLLLKRFDLTPFAEQAPFGAEPTKEAMDDKNGDRFPLESKDHKPPPVDVSETDPIDRVMKYVAIGFVVLILLVIATSFSNMKKYYVKATGGNIEVWKGSFSPMGSELFVRLPEMPAPASRKPVYNQEEVFPLIFDYYIKKADALLNVPDVPDFKEIKTQLERSLSFATTQTRRKLVETRLNSIDLMLLLYKADVTAGQGTLAGLKAAKDFLDQAAALNLDPDQAKLVNQKIITVGNQMALLKAKRGNKTKEPVPKK